MIRIKKNIDLVGTACRNHLVGTACRNHLVGTACRNHLVGTACRTVPTQVRSRDVLWTRRQPVPIEPLVTFRILFGAMMAIGVLRFAWNGWIERLYIDPNFHFKFYGFEWVQPLGETGIYIIFGIIALSAFLIMLGLFYRAAIITFFLSFTYVELLDATHYLNHYYLVCLLAFLMIFLPAHRAFSLDVWRKPELRLDKVPVWAIQVLMLQIAIVYTCAGIAKLNPDWLFRAMPLAVWLPEHSDMPILGHLFTYSWVAFAFSWAGAVYDLTIAFFLLNARTRPYAYLAVIVFHVLTGCLFNIGLFPVIMIFGTLIFFSVEFHRKLLGVFGYRTLLSKPYFLTSFATFFRKKLRKKSRIPAFGLKPATHSAPSSLWNPQGQPSRTDRSTCYPLIAGTLILFFLIQILLPFRHHFYEGNLLWTEEGYRFSWRVMLVEKVGTARFQVMDKETGRRAEVINADYLTAYQEKQMSIQPDFILQFAHHLENEFKMKYDFQDPVVTVDAHIALNGRPSQQFIDPEVNLVAVNDNFKSKYWVMPLKE